MDDKTILTRYAIWLAAVVVGVTCEATWLAVFGAVMIGAIAIEEFTAAYRQAEKMTFKHWQEEHYGKSNL